MNETETIESLKLEIELKDSKIKLIESKIEFITTTLEQWKQSADENILKTGDNGTGNYSGRSVAYDLTAILIKNLMYCKVCKNLTEICVCNDFKKCSGCGTRLDDKNTANYTLNICNYCNSSNEVNENYKTI